jgi:hypothetical protein
VALLLAELAALGDLVNRAWSLRFSDEIPSLRSSSQAANVSPVGDSPFRES